MKGKPEPGAGKNMEVYFYPEGCIAMDIAQKITSLRKEKKWSQEELGKIIKIKAPHISRYENGKSLPSAEALKRLAGAFGVTTDYLLYENVPRNGQVRLKDPEIIEQLEKLDKLDEEDKKAIKRMIKAMIRCHEIEEVVKK